MISNGLAWSPDGRTMYHADTPTHDDPRVTTTTSRTGTPSRPRVFAQFDAARPTGPTAAPSTAPATTGPRSTAAARSCSCRRAATMLAEYPVPAMCPTMCAFGGPDLHDAVRDERAPDARRPTSSRACRSRAASSRCASTCPACPSRASPADERCACISIPPPTCASTSPQSLGTTATGASFATSTGDILEVTALRRAARSACASGRNTRPDYGIVVGRAQARARSRSRRRARGRSPPATRRSRSPARRCAFALLWKGAPVLHVDHRRALPRLDAPADVRPPAPAAGCGPRRSRSQSGEPVYGLGEKFGPLNKRGQLIHSQVEDALGVNTGLVVQEHAVRVESRAPASGAWGMFVHTPGMVTHGVGHPGLVASQLRGASSTTRRSISSCSPRDTPAGDPRRATRSSPAARRAVPRWSLGLWVSRAYYKTPEEAIAVAREAARAPHSLRRADARRPRRVERRDALRLRVGSRALPRSARHARRDQRARPARLRLGVSVRVGPLAAVPASSRSAASC